MLGDDMYLSLADMVINSSDPQDQSMAMITAIQDKLGDSYLKIPFTADVTQLGFSTLNGAGMRNAFYSDATTLPMVDFYHQENPFTYYGVPSYNICNMTQKLGSSQSDVNECYRRVDDIRVHTDGKGIIVLTLENGAYNLSLDDKYASVEGGIPTHFLRKPILTRNSEKLHKIDIQLSEDFDDRIKYEDNKFTVDYSDEE